MKERFDQRAARGVDKEWGRPFSRIPRHAAMLRKYIGVKADRLEDSSLPTMRRPDEVIIGGALAEPPIREEIGRWTKVRGMPIETFEKITRLKRRRETRLHRQEQRTRI